MSDTLFEKIGGEAAVSAAVDVFYRRVLVDDRIAHFFEGVDMDAQHAKQKAFLSFVCGGPKQYSGKEMRSAHASLVKDKGLSDIHFDAVMEHLGGALQQLGVAEEQIAEIAAVAEGTRANVLGK